MDGTGWVHAFSSELDARNGNKPAAEQLVAEYEPIFPVLTRVSASFLCRSTICRYFGLLGKRRASGGADKYRSRNVSRTRMLTECAPPPSGTHLSSNAAIRLPGGNEGEASLTGSEVRNDLGDRVVEGAVEDVFAFQDVFPPASLAVHLDLVEFDVGGPVRRWCGLA